MPICKKRVSFNSRLDWMVSPPGFLRKLYPGGVWRKHPDKLNRRVFLTFDDGPVPGITPWVVDLLKSWEAVGTFFCVGDNIRKYPAVYARLQQEEGMEAGCHGYRHIPGHHLEKQEFLGDLEKALSFMPGVRLYRPPHGIIYPWWIQDLKSYGLEMIMWDVLSRDYNRALTPEQIIRNVTRHVRPGSVVVFHDSLRAWPNLKVALPVILKWLKENDFDTGVL